jgi:hypothetical protein
MLVKCTNPSCSASFRYLRDGRLFRLELDPTLCSSKSNRVEYFWLCHRCSSEMTLRLREDGTVVTVLLPEPIRGVPDGVSFSWQIEKKDYCCVALALLHESTLEVAQQHS